MLRSLKKKNKMNVRNVPIFLKKTHYSPSKSVPVRTQA